MASNEGSPAAARAVRELVERLNAAWPARRWDELLHVFHVDVVLVPAGSGSRVVGRDAVIESYRDFVDQAVLHGLEMGRAAIDVFGSTAVALCPYTVDYEFDGVRRVESGHDLLVLRGDGASWRVVWRAVLADEQESV